MAREENEKECLGTQLWARFGAWGAPCGCFEASELLVTPAFLPAIFFSPLFSPHPYPRAGRSCCPAPGGWGERRVLGARPHLWLFWGGHEGTRSDFPQVSGRGQGHPGRAEVAASLPVVSSPPLLFLLTPFPASTSPGCPGDGADVFTREAPGEGWGAGAGRNPLTWGFHGAKGPFVAALELGNPSRAPTV